jgi:signal peptidase
VGGEEQLSVASVQLARRGRLASFTAIASVALHAVLGFAGVLAAALIVPSFLGYGSLTVLSGSMEPALRVGDVVVEHRVPPLSLRVGDVVTFRDPANANRLYTHRVVSLSASDGSVAFVTRGDANTGVERWSVPEGGSVGRVEYRIPLLGYATNRAGSRMGKFALLVVPALLLGVGEVRRIWRKPDA